MNVRRVLIIKYFIVFFVSFSFWSCDNLKQIPIENFIGDWELKGRSMFDGIKINIKEESSEFVGRISELNSDKYVMMFAGVGDVWVKSVKRSSNAEFKVKEKRIGSALFGIYGLSSTDEYKITFTDKNKIELSPGVFYQRIQKE